MLAYATFAGLLSDFGQLLPTIRGMSQDPGREALIVGRTIWPRVIWGAVGSVVLLSVGWMLGYPILPLALFVAASLVESIFTMLVRSHEVHQAMRRVTLLVIGERLSYAAWVLSAIVIQPTLTTIAAATLASILSMLGVAAWNFRRHYGWSWPRCEWSIVRAGTLQGLPLLIAGLLGTVYYRLDIVLLEQMISATEAGFYNASMRVVESLMFVPMSLMSTLFPLLASMFESDRVAFRQALRRAGWLMGWAGMSVGAVVVFWSDELITLLYGDAFGRAGSILMIMGPMLFFYFLNFLASQALVAMHRDRLMTIVTAVAATLATCLNLIFIPKYGATSSAAVRVVVEGLMAASYVGIIVRTIRSAPVHTSPRMTQVGG
jgi:O-antigen/teichoic acid export membrane protein